MLRLRSHDGPIQSDGHGDWVWQRYPVFAGLFEESLLRAAVALHGKLGDACAETQNLLNVGWIQYRFAAAEVPADKFNGKTTSHHDARRFRITPDVVFGRGSDVALAAGRAAHDHTATHFRSDARLLLQGERDIRKRAQRDHYKAGVRFNR